MPMLTAKRANNIIERKIEKAKNEWTPDFQEDTDYENLKERYKCAIATKNRFEDKAKTIFAALTIAITLMLLF